MTARRRDTLLLAILLSATIALSIAAAGDGILPGDVRFTRWVQANPIPFAEPLTAFTNDYGAGLPLTVAGGVLAVALLAARRVDAALLIALATALRSANSLLKTVVDSARPTPDLVAVTEEASSRGFPSGHAMGSALLLGAVAYALVRLLSPRPREHGQPGVLSPLTGAPSSLTGTNGRPADISPLPGGEGSGARAWGAVPRSILAHRPGSAALPYVLRAAVVACLALIVLVGYGRIYVGAHWPSDVLGGWLWGVILLVVAVGITGLAERRGLADGDGRA